MRTNAEAAAEIDELRHPVELRAAAADEAGKKLDCRQMRSGVGELRAEMQVDAGDVEVELAAARDGRERRVRR